MDYVILGLLIVILILVIISLFKNINESNIYKVIYIKFHNGISRSSIVELLSIFNVF